MTRKPRGSNPRNLTPEQIEYKRKKAKEDYWKNAEEHRRKSREAAATDREAARKRCAEYYKENKNKVSAHQKEKRQSMSAEERELERKTSLDYYHKNKDKIDEQKKAYRKVNPEKFVNEKSREKNRKYHKEKKDKIRERKKKYREDHPEIFQSEEFLKKSRKAKREYYETHKEHWEMTREDMDHANELERKRYENSEEHRTKRKNGAKDWFKKNPEKIKANRLKNYGMTLDDFNELLAFQNGKCPICGYSDMSNPKLFPFVDHCHINNHVRGLLCAKCNYGIGHFNDSPALLKKAARYLEKYALFGPITK